MVKKLISYYSILLGIGVISIWLFNLVAGKIDEGPVEIAFHLVSEFLMAFTCILSGILLLTSKKIGRTLTIFGHGMVVYSVLNAAGYYGEHNESTLVYVFMGIMVLSLLVVAREVFMILRKRQPEPEIPLGERPPGKTEE